MIDNTKEYIICSAYRRKTPSDCTRLIYKHPSLKEEFGEFDDIYDLRLGRHHAEILHMFSAVIDRKTDGFYTSYGRWVDRKTAAELAIASGQVTKEDMINPRMGLDSSDIFK